jgi:hypothetical protein
MSDLISLSRGGVRLRWSAPFRVGQQPDHISPLNIIIFKKHTHDTNNGHET